MALGLFFCLKLEIRDRLTSARQKTSFFSSFLQSFQSSKKTWMFTWACSSSLSPAARVGTVPLLGFFSVLLCKRIGRPRPDRADSFFNVGFLTLPPAGRRLNISAENDCRRLHCSLRDLSSLLQAVGRLAEHFIGEIFAARFSDALAVVERSACRTLF